MRPDDLVSLTVPAHPTLHGELLLVAVSTPDREHDDYRGGLRRIDPAGGAPVAWTAGPHDSTPVLSPDGAWVAFLRAGEDSGPAGKDQLHVMSTTGGEARRITELPLGVSDPVWAPDSRRIAFLARIPEPGRYGTPAREGEDAPEPAAEPPRRITRQDFRLDNIGFLRDRHVRLFVVDALTGSATPTELTAGGCDVAGPVWTPDGERIVFSAPRDLGVQETLHEDLFVVPAAGGEVSVLVTSGGDASKPAVTADGQVLFYGTEFTGRDSAAHSAGLFAVPLTGGTPRRLTDLSVDCERSTGAPIPFGADVLVTVRHRGAVELRRVPLSANGISLAELPVVLGERALVTGFTTHGNTIAATVSTSDSSGEVVRVVDGVAETLTDFSAPLRATGLHEIRELTGAAADGYPVHGFLVLPDGPGPHPVLLHVHGGPFSFHRWAFFDEAQVYASAGYAVVLPNPRGSSGYGQEHGRAVVNAFGENDVVDVLAVLDLALADPACDAERVGVMGGSYGGFMTSWLAGNHGERFRAAWSERAVNAWDSFLGSSDIGSDFVDDYVGGDRDTQWRKSPLAYADNIRIPFLVAHSEHDWRCPIEQGQRMFVALQRNGVESEFLLFPGEGHELSRSGRPSHRVQRFEAVLDWWSRHLKPAA
ncbi:MAG TPA: S9 family peptidase [Pseudonocardiaceae bacterium]|nr:S9 family peptidase [Pseudonocardiaceae bacterium]